MSMTDPIADLLTRIRNAQSAGHDSVSIPYSKMKEALVKIFEEEGFIGSHVVEEASPCSFLKIVLRYQDNREPLIRCLKRVSKPGRRVYAGKDDIPLSLGGLGAMVLSTSSGVMTGKKARQAEIGGEVLCEIY